jgi:hypothetical protein
MIAGLMLYHVAVDNDEPKVTRRQGMFDWLTKPRVATPSIEELLKMDQERQQILRNQQLIESGAGTTAPLPVSGSSSSSAQNTKTTVTVATTTTTSSSHSSKPKSSPRVATDPLGGGDGVVLTKLVPTKTTTTISAESTELNLSHIPTSSGATSASSTMDHDRLHLYCNEQILPGVEGSTKFHGHEHFVLKDLIITIRHGDRSGIHVMPGSERVAHDSNYHSYHQDHPLIDQQALRYANKLGNLQIVKLPTKEKETQKVHSFVIY